MHTRWLHCLFNLLPSVNTKYRNTDFGQYYIFLMESLENWMGLEIWACHSLVAHLFSGVHCQFSMVFKVIRKCWNLSYWKEIKTDWDLRRKRSVVRVFKGTIPSRSSLCLPLSPLFAPLKRGLCTANASLPLNSQDSVSWLTNDIILLIQNMIQRVIFQLSIVDKWREVPSICGALVASSSPGKR